MEKPPVRSKGSRLLKFLPKGTSFSIPNPPYSPGREKTHARKGFSGPIFSIVPAEARRKPTGRGYETPEPTSPKVSCIGQVKHKTKACGKSRRHPSPPTRTGSKPWFSMGRMFRGRSKKDRSRVGGGGKPPAVPGWAPPLGQMRRFASGRDAFASFDWKAPRVADDSGEFYSEDFSHDEFSDEEEHVRIPHSAPILVGGGGGWEPRKEVNLWKRRTMSPPSPLTT